MKNPFAFLAKKNQIEDTYLGLFLKENEGMLFYISQITPGNLKINRKEKFTYTDGWEKLAEDVDEVLNKLETTTGKSPEKTVFFIYSNLVDPVTKQIKRPYLHKIKQLVKNLELKPLGFIECHEAISDDLQQKEKMPLTANLIEFDKTALSVFVYTTGRLIFSETVSRTENLINDLLPIFEKIKTQTVIPPRIILYDSKDLDLESTSILTHQWGKDFFIQLPRVQIFKEEQVIESFLKIFSSQMGGDEQLIMEREEQATSTKPQEVMGFVIGEDVKEKPVAPPPEEKFPDQTPRPKQPRSISSLIPTAFLSKFFATSKKRLGQLFERAKSLPFPVLPLAGAVLIIGALFIIEYFFHTAKVRVFFPAQSLTKSLEIEALVGASPPNSQTLLFQVATEAADFSQTKTATGSRSIGEKAKGTVSMLNYDSNSTSFDQGTTIQAQGLKFVLEDKVTVASASVAPDLSLQPGKGKASVLAEEIGPESNLAKDQKFQVGDFPQNRYLANNENAFSGGSKRNVQTVSEEDVSSLEDAILAKAKKHVDGQVKSKLPQGAVLLPQLTSYDLGEITYSQKVGDEATSVEGKSAAQITYFTYKQKDFLQIINLNLKPEVKSGFKISDKATNYKIKEINQDDDNYLFSVDVRTKAVEDIKTAELLAKTRGKTSEKLQNLVKDEYHADGVELEVSHPIPWLKNWLPLFKKNINLEISYL